MGDESQIVFAIARIPSDAAGNAALLGTGFAIREGYIATPFHVVGPNPSGLSIVIPRMRSLADYQDTSDHGVRAIPVEVVAADPVRDVCLLKLKDAQVSSQIELSSTDALPVGGAVHLFGFPHAGHGRMVLTRQHSSVGARVLINSGAVKSKHLILNIQTRDGQSGSPVIADGSNKAIAMVLGSYAPTTQGTLMLNDINPATLHQTTRAISCEYLKEMIP